MSVIVYQNYPVIRLEVLGKSTARLSVELSRSLTIRHTSWTSDRLVAQAVTYATYNRHGRRTFMPSTGLETAIPAIKRLQACALDRTATEIGS